MYVAELASVGFLLKLKKDKEKVPKTPVAEIKKLPNLPTNFTRP